MIKVFIGRSILVLAFVLTFANTGWASPDEDLPVKEILGKEYYVYEAKKGESMYGVAKKFGWDIEELIDLNPDLKARLGKGDLVYYPTGKNAISSVTDLSTGNGFIHHRVRKGENVYSISTMYDTPLPLIYKYNPESQKGVKPGDMLQIPQNIEVTESGSSPVFSSKESPLKSPDLASAEGRNEETLTRHPSTHSRRSGYKKNDSEQEPVIILEESQSDLIVVQYPKVSEEDVEIVNSQLDGNNIDNTSEATIYEGNEWSESIEMPVANDLKLALVLDDPNSKKDIDFTRGMLIALSEFKEVPYKINLKVLDGGVSTSELISTLDDFEPTLIFSTADKTFPLFLADYGNSNNVGIVNVFDLKTDLYSENPSIIQVLPPSSYFNEKVANEIHKKNQLRKLLIVGEPDPNDGIAQILTQLYGNGMETLSLEDFGALEPDLMESVLIYSFANKKEEVWDFINNVDNLADNYPGYDFHVVGRQSWIAMTDEFEDKFKEYNVFIPARVWMNADSPEWKNFMKEYKEYFDGAPVRSIPNFAAAGYDLMKYFANNFDKGNGEIDTKPSVPGSGLLQNDFGFRVVSEGGGLVNDVSYLVNFNNRAGVEKLIIR